MLNATILPAIAFGVGAAVIPGPLLAFLISTILTRGARVALLVVLAPLLTDAPIILLMTFVLGQLPPTVLQLIQLAGGCLLLSIAWGAARRLDADSLLRLAPEAAESQSGYRVLLTAIAMNCLSPGPWLFWATVNGPLLLAALGESLWLALAFLLAFYGVFLGGLCLWIALFHQLRRVDARYLRALLFATTLLLLWFGVGLMVEALDASHLQPLVALALASLILARRVWRKRCLAAWFCAPKSAR